MSAKEIIVKVIDSKTANEYVKKYHYSGKVVNNSTLHFGVFYHGVLGGVMSYGNSTTKEFMLGLVKDTKWNGFIELNRMAFSDFLPKNSESRALAISFKLIRKNAPHIKWIISFADATQCGDGTIYRASGFLLTGIKKNTSMVQLPDGTITHKMNFSASCSRAIAQKWNPSGKPASQAIKECGAKRIEGFQIRYIKFLNAEDEKDLNVPVLPYSEIDRQGVRMYKGKKIDNNPGMDTIPERGSSTVRRDISNVETAAHTDLPAPLQSTDSGDE